MFDDVRPTVRTWLTTPMGWVSIALLLVEFISGMQTFVTTQINPLIASDLGATGYLGPMFGAAFAASVITMPLGSNLLGRFRASTLLMWLTVISVVGGVVSAAAPTIAVFLVGRLVTGLAAGALTTVSMGTIVTVLPGRWRQLVLAGYSAMWVITAVAGPAYATVMVHAFSWRWAMVAYLPFLVAARALLARHLPHEAERRDAPPARLGSSAMLAAAVALIAIIGNVGAWWPLAAGAALVVTLVAAARILPRGVLRAKRGRPAAVGIQFVLCASYFGAMETLSVITQNVQGRNQTTAGTLLGVGALAWAVVGVLTGRRPAASPRSYRRRALIGACLLGAGIAGLAAAYVVPPAAASTVLLYLSWCVAGVGMGLVYLDTINAIVTEPVPPDGISELAASGATVQSESIANAVVATGAVAALSGLLAISWTPAPWVVTLALAALALTIVPLALRATSRTPAAAPRP